MSAEQKPSSEPLFSWSNVPANWRIPQLRHLFDEPYYRAQLDRRPVSDDLLVDYLMQGSRELLDPHPLFSTHYYLSHSPDVARVDVCPLVHFIQFGLERRLFHPLFDIDLYMQQGVSPTTNNVLSHYVRTGMLGGLRTTDLFDIQFYERSNRAAKILPHLCFMHFMTKGFKEGRDPHPAFDLTFYLKTHPELDPEKDNALVHFALTPDKQRDAPNPTFDYKHYVTVSPDVVASGACPVRHYLAKGYYEGRVEADLDSVTSAMRQSQSGAGSFVDADTATPTIILGMHRSGTSTAAQLLKAMGAETGQTDRQIPANEWNQRGYYELSSVASLNDQLLSAQQCSWDDPVAFRLSLIGTREQEEAQRRLLASMAAELAEQSPCVKDPRFSLTWPLFADALPAARLLLIVRDPMSVAQSLWRRDDMPLSLGTALWEAYNLAALRSIRGRAAMIVSYSQMLTEPLQTAQALANFCNLSVDERAIEDVIDRKLDHGKPTAAPYGAADALYQTLMQTQSPDDIEIPKLSPIASDLLVLQSRFRKQFDRANRLTASLANRDWLDRRLDRLKTELLAK